MDNDFGKVALKVDSNNIPALNLYLSLGFIIKRELYTFEKTKV
jgi:ribosomal protein S18 acetylase RimI-like enzyme